MDIVSTPRPTLLHPFDRARLRQGLRWLCLGLAPATAVLVPISTTGGAIASTALVVCWFLGGVRERGLGVLVRNPVGVAALAMFGWMAASVLWSAEPTDESLRMLVKYRPLLFVPILLSLFEDERLRRWTTTAFVGTMVLVLFASLPARLGWIAPTHWATSHNGGVFKNHLVQNVLMAFAAFLLARSAMAGGRWRWVKAVLAGLATVNVLCLVDGRTGYLLVGVLALYLCGTRWGAAGLVRGFVGAAIAGVVLLAFVPTFRNRIGRAVDEFAGYRAGGSIGDRNSIGLRLQFWETSLAVAAERPLLGHGVGSFESAYAVEADTRGIIATRNPHNEYLMTLVQTGAVGTLLLVLLFGGQWHLAGRLPPDRRVLARGLVLLVAVGCVFNSMLLDNTESHVYALFSAVAFAGLPAARNPSPEDEPTVR